MKKIMIIGIGIFFTGITQGDATLITNVNAHAEAAMLPVSTPEMTPGIVSDRPLNLHGIGMLFLLGDDPTSVAWLTKNALQLKRHRAEGLAVNIKDIDDLQALRQLAPSVRISPASGSELSRRLQLFHYPVVLTDKALSQQLSHE
jgi:integrating conjugative element protein (TIGR03765 family)